MSLQELVQRLNWINSERTEIRRLLIKYIKENIKKFIVVPTLIKPTINKIRQGKGGQVSDKKLIETSIYMEKEA
jgi:hypothetical protein